MAGTYENVAAVVRKEDASLASDAICLALSRLFRVPTFFPSWIRTFRELIFISKPEVIFCVVRCDVAFII